MMEKVISEVSSVGSQKYRALAKQEEM